MINVDKYLVFYIISDIIIRACSLLIKIINIHIMSKGITKACPNCKKIVLRYANFKGEGGFETKCPHCDSLVRCKFEIEYCLKIELVV